jgi:hypothetical protein
MSIIEAILQVEGGCQCNAQTVSMKIHGFGIALEPTGRKKVFPSNPVNII